MKFFFIFLLLIWVQQISIAQITDGEKTLRTITTDSLKGWKKGGVLGLNFSQASFKNWASGGQNSVATNGLVSVFANYKKNKATWDNMLDLGYGLMQQGKAGFIKTDDKIDFSSKFGSMASKSWYYAALINFKSQMTPGYNYPDDSTIISDFLAPAYLLGAVGMDYKPNDKITTFFAPLTSKTTIVGNTILADAGAFGVDAASYDNAGLMLAHGKKMRSEFGGYVKIVYKETLFKDKSVSILSKLDLFSNYLQNPQNIDVSWENIFGFKVNKYISATLTTHLIYDDDVSVAVDTNADGVIDESGPRTQFKEVIGIGFSYKF